MGIELLEGPDRTAQGSAGKFDLPLGFDTKKHAAQWVNSKEVESHRGRERLLGIRATADGWSVYKDEKNGGKVTKVTVKEGEFTLMVRPREVQDAVNILYGNLGKTNALAEQEGDLVAGKGQNDPGMLPEKTLKGLGLATGELERNAAQFTATPIPHIGSPKNEHVDATRST